MGRIYKPVVVSSARKEMMTVAFVDTGADESVMSERLAINIEAEQYGIYRAYSASNNLIEGRLTTIVLKSDKISLEMEVGVTDAPFKSEYLDEEGVDLILGVDFLQDIKANLHFS